MEPVKLFRPRFKVVSVLERVPSSSGMSPIRALAVKFNLRRLARVPSSAGMLPVRPMFPLPRVLARSNSCKLVRVPRAAGMLPLTLVAETLPGLPPTLWSLSGLIFNSFTYVYGGESGPRVMPSQSAIGFLISQSSVALPCRVFLTFRSVLQSATRLSGSSGTEPGIA